eukprot:m.120621 g.120621  ORF g.120621 m.120621 type:complete len:188 (+) comp17244_c0_seq1:67-630(+)
MVVLRAKCLVLGDSTVGKTALIQSLVTDGTNFPADYVMTTGVEYCVHSITIADSEDAVELHIHDSTGRDEFSQFSSKLWAEPSMVVLVFDVTNESSFTSLHSWLEKYKKLKPGIPVRGVLVAMKTDLSNLRVVSTESADEFAVANSLAYFEVSAKESKNVAEPFTTLSQNYHSHYEETLGAMTAAAS